MWFCVFTEVLIIFSPLSHKTTSLFKTDTQIAFKQKPSISCSMNKRLLYIDNFPIRQGSCSPYHINLSLIPNFILNAILTFHNIATTTTTKNYKEYDTN